MGSIKYTKEVLEPLVQESYSFRNVVRLLGIRLTPSNQAHIANRIRHYGIDTSHFTGKGHNKGKPSNQRKASKEVLVLSPAGAPRTKAASLRRALEEEGVEYICTGCDNRGLWNELPLTLQVDHINDDWLDNRIENLQYLCPNCHFQKTQGVVAQLAEAQD